MPMQNSSFRKPPSWLSWLFVVMFFAHFSLIGIYQFGHSVLPAPVMRIADIYNLPWFFQNYKMFAPDPVSDINTFVYRVKQDDAWSAWKNPVFPYQQLHWNHRLSYGQDMYRILNGIGDGLFNGIHYSNFIDTPTVAQWHHLPGFLLAEAFVKQTLQDTGHAGIEAFQVGVFTEHHWIDEEGVVKQTILFQAYPRKMSMDE